MDKEQRKQYKKKYREEHKEQSKKWREENKEQIAEYNKKYREENKEQMTEYKKKWDEENKEQIAEYNKKWREENKEQIAEYDKKYREEHKEQRNEQSKKWREENPEYKKKYYEENKERIAEKSKKYYEENKEQRNEYQKNRIKNDENFRIRRCLSTALAITLKKSNTNKKNKTMTYVGCSKEELLLHLKSTKKTEWQNEKLHIDHIIPRALYDHTDEDEIYKCWNWRNLRYLPEKENLSKHNKLDMNLVKQCAIEDLLPKEINYELS
jgi:hypothetical protein